MNEQDFHAKLWRHDGGQALMRAVGFGDPVENQTDNTNTASPVKRDGDSVKLGCRTTISLKGMSAGFAKAEGGQRLPVDLIQSIKSYRVEIEHEIVALEGAPSVSAAVREMRLYNSLREVRNGVETALTIVRNVLNEPKDLKMHRVKRSNPAFQRTLGRLKSSELLMHAIGYLGGQAAHIGVSAVPSAEPFGDLDRMNGLSNAAYVLQSLSKGGFDATTALTKGAGEILVRSDFLPCLLPSFTHFFDHFIMMLMLIMLMLIFILVMSFSLS